MHPNALVLMEKHLRRTNVAGCSVLDVGSLDVNGTFRPLVEGLGGVYTGVDIRSGANVDVVPEYPYKYPFEDESFDIVICGNMLHNVYNPFDLIKEMCRVLKRDGFMVVVTVWKWGISPYPVDYWRFTDKGLEVLFVDATYLTDFQTGIDEIGNTAGSAFKR